MRNTFLIVLLFIAGLSISAQTVTTGSLLEELIDREALVRFPSPGYTLKQFSSYDRASVGPNIDGWFGNEDNNQFLRIETNMGRREYVLFDAQGPGAVVRFWATVAGYSKQMYLRIYIDGKSIPAIQGELLSILGNGGLVAAPLAASVASSTGKEQRGYNFYLPVPYAQSCKITVECENTLVSPPNGEVLYYNINYRTYPAGTNVLSFSQTDISTYKNTLSNVVTALRNYDRQMPANTLAEQCNNLTLATGQRASLQFSGSKAIRQIQIKLSAADFPQALRSTVLSVSFDGEQRVWAPVGDFFGTGYLLSPYKSWYSEVSAGGTMTSYWLMPFAEQCTVNLENLGAENVQVEIFEALSVDRAWDATRDMYFGAGWYEKYNMPTLDETGNHFDLNLVTLTGKGKLVGNGVTLFNTAAAWWGEGDEKIYVDNETFPSCFGTGSEDYYGYAWCLPAKFYHPFIAQPNGSGNLKPGYSVNLRYYSLDAIPFFSKLQFDMEMWHWTYTRMNYAPITYFYMQSGSSNLGANTEMAQKKVITDRNQLINNIVNEQGVVEFENMPDTRSGGNNQSQYDSFGLQWGERCQSWWRDATRNDWIEYSFVSAIEGTFPLEINITKANDYARFDVYFNDVKCTSVDAYSPFITTAWISLGEKQVRKGENRIKIVLTGRNPASVGNVYMVGFDRLQIHNYYHTGVKNLSVAASIYPNPVTDKLIIAGENLKIDNVQIFNLSGKQMIRRKLSILNSQFSILCSMLLLTVAFPLLLLRLMFCTSRVGALRSD
jgi:hypothetical protein